MTYLDKDSSDPLAQNCLYLKIKEIHRKKNTLYNQSNQH